MNTFTLRIDHADCWGCMACQVACKQETGAPEGINLIEVREEGPMVVDGKPHFTFRVHVCRHCDDPPCAEVCPVKAIVKRDDGIVILNGKECTGCGSCLEACPYGAISFDEESGVAWKCNLCYQRVDQGLYPACADNVCLGHCIHFGAPDEVEEKMAQRDEVRARGKDSP